VDQDDLLTDNVVYPSIHPFILNQTTYGP